VSVVEPVDVLEVVGVGVGVGALESLIVWLMD
jgi:hypothetical protein